MATSLIGKKYRKELGTKINGTPAASISSFAVEQMYKMGWKDGKGLGKNEVGVTAHVSLQKRDDCKGIGFNASNNDDAGEWWHRAFTSAAIKVAAEHSDRKSKTSRNRKRKKKDRNSKDLKGHVEKADEPTFDELFAATGGKLFGRRAYRGCTGKLKRAKMVDVIE